MNKLYISLVLAVLAAVFGAARIDAASLSTLTQRVVLADNTLDSTPTQRAEAIRDVARMADLAAGEHGMLAAAPFQSGALATITWPIRHRFQPKPSDPNSYYKKLDLQQQADVVKQRAKKLFGKQRKVQGTDLLGGLLAVANFFPSQPAGPRTLVVASNMWLDSKSDGVILKKQALSPSQINRLINKLDRTGRIARLRGVCVYVIGGGLDPNRQIPNTVQVSMRRFWAAYFTRAHARVRAWTPTLVSDPSC